MSDPQQFHPQYPPQYDLSPTPPQHPTSTSAMALGLIGLIGVLFCAGVTLLVSPFAWALGTRAIREIDADPTAYSGREMAMAGKIMGIIGTVLLILAVIALVLVVAFFAWTIQSDDFHFSES
mgnify:CR=1 FL=1